MFGSVEWRAPPSRAEESLWLRRLAAVLMHGASRALARAAVHLLPEPRRVRSAPPVLEFHADAGAPEGALYVDGELVVRLPGVTRL